MPVDPVLFPSVPAPEPGHHEQGVEFRVPHGCAAPSHAGNRIGDVDI